MKKNKEKIDNIDQEAYCYANSNYLKVLYEQEKLLKDAIDKKNYLEAALYASIISRGFKKLNKRLIQMGENEYNNQILDQRLAKELNNL